MKRSLTGFLLSASVALAVIFMSSSFTSEAEIFNEIELGRKLFFDPILSLNRQTSCADCHKPEFAFADTAAFSKGFAGKNTLRNTQGLTNLTSRPYFFWDGRVGTLEEQAMHPVTNPLEMGMSRELVTRRLRENKEYKKWFRKVYGKAPDQQLASRALAAFERTLETGDSPFDLFMNGDSLAITPSAIRGREVFMEKGKCFECHFSPDFTGDEFRNVGLFNGKNLNDSGRMTVTGQKSDLGKFRVPGLRNVSLTAPYMHNGMFRTLAEVIDYYNDPDKFVNNSINRDTLLNSPLGLTNQEKEDLLNFLKSLTSPQLPLQKRP